MSRGPGQSMTLSEGRAGAGDPSKAQVGAGGEKLGGEGDGSVWRQGRQTVMVWSVGGLTIFLLATLSFPPISSQYQKQPNEGYNWCIFQQPICTE